MKYLFVAIIVLVLASPVSAASCNTSELASLYETYKVNFLKGEFDKAQAAYTEKITARDAEIAAVTNIGLSKAQRSTRVGEIEGRYRIPINQLSSAIEVTGTAYYTARAQANKACETLAQDKVEQKEQADQEKAEAEARRLRDEETARRNAERAAALEAHRKALYAEPVESPKVEAPKVEPKVAPKAEAKRAAVGAPVVPVAPIVESTSTPTIQEQVESQPTVAGESEAVPAPESEPEGFIRSFFRSISKFFKKLW